MILAVLLVGIILIQKNTQDGLQGIAGGGSNSQSFLSSAASASFLTRTTAVIAACFMINSLVLANLSNVKADQTAIEKIENKAKEQSLPMAE